jgi:6-phosphogluconolactonase/glucosamine-6-phosphate isomerase/deaminase
MAEKGPEGHIASNLPSTFLQSDHGCRQGRERAIFLKS